MWCFDSPGSSFCSQLTNLTSLTLTVISFRGAEMQLIRKLLENNPKLSCLTIMNADIPGWRGDTQFAALPLNQLTELNLSGVMLSSKDLEATIDILGQSTKLTTLRSIKALCNVAGGLQLEQPTPQQCDVLLRKLVSSLTNLRTLHMVTQQGTLQSANVSFTALTKLTQLATCWKEFESGIETQEPQKLMDDLKALYPPQLQEVDALLLSTHYSLRAVSQTPFGFCTALHAAASFTFHVSAKAESWLNYWPASKIDVEDSEGRTPLMYAALRSRRPNSAAALISAGANIFHRARGWYGRHSVFAAAQNKAVLPLFLPHFCAELKASGSDHSIALDAIGCTPLMLVREKEAVEMLVQCAELSAAFPPLTTASFRGWNALQWHSSLRQYLVDSSSPLLAGGQWNVAHRDAEGRSILWTCGNLQAASALLTSVKSRDEFMSLWKKTGTHVESNARATTLLTRMARCYNEDFGRKEIENELDRVLGFLSPEEINAVDHRGRSALCHAIRTRGGLPFSSFLLERSAHRTKVNINAGAPLHEAIMCYHGDQRVAESLLKAGADANCCDSFGANSLNVFLRFCFLSFVDLSLCSAVLLLLLDSGANPLQSDADGYVPLHWLCKLAARPPSVVGKIDYSPWNRLIAASAAVSLRASKRGDRPVDFLFETMEPLVHNPFARNVVRQMLSAGLDTETLINIDGAQKHIGSIVHHVMETKAKMK
eukprot:TRINITY_DN1707_c0_g2_i1.p1 TRINITY_DN1707_c0_g2~~TRINITY_DN1707_c0_g2_i1.p1  ORF type:complete len:713 (-),score=86.95 TRINITY_DN1707_c0_g2_i1:471-2609(-)